MMETKNLNLIKEKTYAIVQVKPGMEIKLLSVLLENGFTNVSFINGNGETAELKGETDIGEEEVIDVESVMENKEIEDKRSTTDNESSCQMDFRKGGNIQPRFSSLTLPTVLFPSESYPFYNPFGPAMENGTNIDQRSIVTDGSYSPSRPDTPPLTPRGSSNESSSRLISGAKLRQRGRQSRRNERDIMAYACCRLCRNRILANRVSNLHNHVRRHAILKQFHCCHCSYAHTEVAKVRLHMVHNHKDELSQPMDKRDEDMEHAWSLLMNECFPGYV